MIYILDWDDTLIPTSLLDYESKRQNVSLYDIKLNHKIKSELKILELHVFNFVEKLLSKGKVYIVTNADINWFKFSAKSFYPNISDFLINLNVISALDIFKKDFPNIPISQGFPINSTGADWKYNAMKKLLIDKEYNTMISIGDAEYEREASMMIKKDNNKKIISIKLIDNPSIEKMILQLKSMFLNINTFENSAMLTNIVF
uniref:Uncharacterized protein n=1 Tax=viral metagenome TaxID=1070528 RepID=A0A6C0ADK9_9ZZZZ